MPTQAGTIITAAINRSTANDGGRSEVSSNTTELLGVLSRTVQRIYVLAGLPKSNGGMADGGYFARVLTVTLGTPATTFVNLPSGLATWTGLIQDAGGSEVTVVTARDLVDGVAEVPPSVVIQSGKIRSAGRLGDPTAGAVLSFTAPAMPGDLTSTAHYIGATTPSDPTTTAWPSWVGDDWLIALLARYLAIKDGTRDAAELQALEADAAAAAGLFAEVVGVEAGTLADVRAA